MGFIGFMLMSRSPDASGGLATILEAQSQVERINVIKIIG